MPGTEFEDSEDLNANMELRLITMELMKLAAKEKKPFREVAERYISNVYFLKRMLEEKGQL